MKLFALINWNQKSKYLLLLLLSTLCVSAFFISRNIDFYYDALDYWRRGTNFSFIHEGFRGYVYPLYLGICQKITSGTVGFRVINSVVISIFFIYIVPYMHGNTIRYKQGISLKESGCIFISFILFTIFFYGLEKYTISDLPAIILCMCSVFCMNKSLESDGKFKTVLYAFLFGMFVYMAYNTRTIYLFAAISIYIFYFFRLLKKKQRKIFAAEQFLVSCFGLGMAALPQIYMNYRNLGIISAKVPTNGLMLNQVTWGMKYQRYATYIGDNHAAPVYFMDPVGNALLDALDITEFSSWGEFIGVCLKYPFECAGIYVRHLVNMLLPCWPNTYIFDLENNKVFYAIISYTLFFLFGLTTLNKCVNNKKVFYNYIPLLVTMLFILPGAVEIRFFAALYLLVIGNLVYNTEWNKVKVYVKNNKVRIIVLYILFGMLLFSMWSSMLVSDSETSLFLY